MLLPLVLLAVGLVGLIAGGNLFVDGSAGLARLLNVRPLIIGLVVIGFGTSAPEMLVTLLALLDGKGGIALGNVVGSNIANIGLVMAAAAIVYPLDVHRSVLRRELPLTVTVTLLFSVLLAVDGRIDMLDGVLLLLAFTLSLAYILGMPFLPWVGRRAARQMEAEVAEIIEESPTVVLPKRPTVAIVQTVGGLALILAGAQFTVDSAATIARQFGVSDEVIGLTLVAVGTSLPELAAGIIAALKRETDLITGNVLGSNMYNLGCTGGLLGLFSGAGVMAEEQLWYSSNAIMIVLTMLLVPVLLRGQRMTRIEGAIILGGYVVFTLLLF
ncbi:MAG TPA: calcium/sodium antiporter [Chloroflexia bacterium]|nr:calcium/sodium antiporter [Chloroflexia bacterium]